MARLYKGCKQCIFNFHQMSIGKDFRSVYLSEAVDKQDAASVIVDVADEAVMLLNLSAASFDAVSTWIKENEVLEAKAIAISALTLYTHLSVTNRCFVKLKKDLVRNNVL